MRGPETPLEGMVDSFIVHRSDLSEATVRNYRVALKAFTRWCERELGRATVGDIEPGTVEAYLRHRKVSVSAETPALVGSRSGPSLNISRSSGSTATASRSCVTFGCPASKRITAAT